MDKINLGDGTQGSGDSGLVGGGKINANYIALVEAILGVTIWSSATSENLDLTTLNTTDKSSIKAAINELLERTKLIDDSLTSSIFKTWSVDKLVATFIQASSLANYLELAGGTLTGALNGTDASFSGAVLSKTNNVQTISNSISEATIADNINVVVVNTSVNCTLTVTTTTNLASIKIINTGSGNVSFSAGASVNVSYNGGHIGVASPNKLYLSATLTKIATDSWIVSE